MAMAAVSAEVKVHTEAFGSEVRFNIHNAAGEEVCQGGYSPRYKSRSENLTDCNVQGSGNTILCTDTYGDGWHGGYVLIKGHKFCEEFRSGRTKVEQITIPMETFDYSSTGGHAAVQSLPLAAPYTAELIRGGGDHGEHTNTLNDKTYDIAK